MAIHPSGPPPLPADPCSIYSGQKTFYDGAAQSCFFKSSTGHAADGDKVRGDDVSPAEPTPFSSFLRLALLPRTQSLTSIGNPFALSCVPCQCSQQPLSSWLSGAELPLPTVVRTVMGGPSLAGPAVARRSSPLRFCL